MKHIRKFNEDKEDSFIPKNDRFYISDWYGDSETPKEDDIVDFEMPSFCSGDYSAKVYINGNGELYIKKNDIDQKYGTVVKS